VRSAVSRETAIGIAVTAVALVAMVFDHLLGDDPGLEDPIAFIVAAVLTLACAFIVFGLVVPRTKRSAAPADRAATRGAVLAVVSVLSISLIWLGVTFPIAGGTLALGLLGARRQSAVAGPLGDRGRLDRPRRRYGLFRLDVVVLDEA
jgi:hypothetical protein